MIKFVYIIMTILLLLGGCSIVKTPKNLQAWSTKGKTMGTYYYVSVINFPIKSLKGLDKAIKQSLIDDNHQISTWQNDSILSKFNYYQGTKPQLITKGIRDIISIALYIGLKTDGKMDITIDPLVNLWGFGPMKQPKNIPSVQKIKNSRAYLGLKYLRLIETSQGQWLQKLVPSIRINLSTLGEGYAVDHIASLLEKRGITNYLVSVGGAVFSRGLSNTQEPWKIAIQHPTNNSAVEAIVNLQGYGISTSGSYRNYYDLKGKKINHIIDPFTGSPINHRLISATVIAKTALEADAWDTGLMVLGAKKAKLLALKESLAVFLIIKTKQGFNTWISPQFSSFLISRAKNS